MTRLRCALVAVLVAVAGCAAQGSRDPLPQPVAVAGLAGVSANSDVQAAPDHWWRRFGDPQLDALVDEALAAAPTLDAARARLQAAEGALTAVRGARQPQLDANASVNRERLSETGLYPPPYGGSTVNLGQLGVDLSYEIDLFGRVRAAVRANVAQVDAAHNDVDAARLGVVSGVVRTYLALARTYAAGATLGDVAAARREVLALTERRVTAGLDTSAEIEQARAAVAAADADIEANAESQSLLRDELAVLVGAGPGRAAAIDPPRLGSAVAIDVPATLPADLLGRRADIRAARARVESAAASVRGAEAAFYPNLNLGAMAGFQSIELGSLLAARNFTWGVGPALTLPLFTGGRLRGALAVQDAGYREAVAGYNDTVIGAYREVADAVASLHALERERAANDTAMAALGHAVELARARYDAGLGNKLAILAAEDRLLLQRRAAVDLDARRADLAAVLFRALGGGLST